MTEWVWVVAGTAASIAVSLVVGLALARILGNIDRAASRLLDDARWAAAPLARVERRSLGSWVSD
jgi:hypothetical protein